MSQPFDPATQGELESLSEAIASGLEPEQVLALIAQRTCQVLGIAEAHILLKQGQELIRKASYQALQETPLLSKLAAGQGVEGWVARRGRAIALEDARKDRRFRSLAVPSASKASAQENVPLKVAAVPIWSGRQVAGVLSVVDFDPPATSVSTPPASVPSASASTPISGLLPLLSVLADLISLAMENTRILAREERRSKLINLLHYMASALPDKVLKEVAEAMEERIGEVMGVQKVEVLLYNEETDELISLGMRDTALGRAQQELGLDHVPLGKGGVLADVFRTGQPFLSNDLDTTPAFPAAFKEKLGVKSALVVPLEVENQRRGLMSVMSSKTDAFSDEDLPFLSLISTRLGHTLHNQELSKELAEAEAERLARTERENFLLLVAHDLKNALTTMRGNAQLALRRATKGDTRSEELALRLISARSDQALQLVNDMVDVNQMESGLFRLYMEPVELVELLQEEVSTVQETSGARHPITFQSDFESIFVEADQYRLNQVLSNLLINAIRYSPQGGMIEVKLSGAPAEANQPAPANGPGEQGQLPQTVMISINDQGIGIPPDEHERIFERSFRGRGAMFAAGSGLGLYISREIIERHGGRLWVGSQQGQGSSFRFTLPTSRSHPHEPV
jgi:signal transduction histidine kinase